MYMNNLRIKSLFICKYREMTGVLITVLCSLGKAEWHSYSHEVIYDFEISMMIHLAVMTCYFD